MPCTLKNAFDEKLTFEKMIEAHERAKIGKLSRYEVADFEFNIENKIVNLVESLKNDRYNLGKYREFVIYEPKERVIKSLPYIDRVVHQWYVEEFIKPVFVPKFIKDTYACLEKRGTHAAIKTMQKYMRMAKREYINYYILKLDIKKFFYNIDHDILYKIINRYITDKKLLSLSKKLIYTAEDKVGIPIGNYTSQFYANIYLGELDRYIKQELKVKYYVRYMDDFILLVENKMEAKRVMTEIVFFLWKNLKLKLNEKSGYYPDWCGVNFGGYRIYNTHILIRRNSVKKMKKMIKGWNKRYYANDLKRLDYLLSFNSWLGHLQHADGYNLKEEMIGRMIFISE